MEVLSNFFDIFSKFRSGNPQSLKSSEIACLRLVSALAVRSMLDLVIVLLAFPSCPVLSNVVFTVRADPSRHLACLFVNLFAELYSPNG